MTETTSPETQFAGRHQAHAAPTPGAASDDFDRRVQRRTELRTRHAQRLARLMEQRADLRGVTPLADLVDDSIRWSA